MAQPEVGPNDIVIHLVNPYKCGDCGSEFCLKNLFLDHLAEHIQKLKMDTPCHQIVCGTNLVEQQPNGITVTRDILQINEQQMFELQDPSIDYTQLTPLKALEQAGILSLPPPKQVQKPPPQPTVKDSPIVISAGQEAVKNAGGRQVSLLQQQNQKLLRQQEESAFNIQVVNTSGEEVRDYSGVPQISVQQVQDGDPQMTELDALVQHALFGDGKIKREYSIAVENPPHLDVSFSGEGSSRVVDIAGKNSLKPAVHEKTNKKSVCSICHHEFASASVLERHQVVHTGEKPYSCAVCFKYFNDVSSLRKHSMIHKRQFRCPICHRMYLRWSQLALHMKQHNKKRFIQFGNSFHEVRVTATRNAAGQMVQEFSLLLLPENQDVKNTSNTEVEVGNQSKESASENTADLVQTENNLGTAETGGEAESSSPNIDSEKSQTEIEQKKKVIYRCGHCKKLIYTRPTLSRHLIKHTNTRPFQCDYCLKTFRDKADLFHHRKTHTKPIQCKSCNCSFSKALYLQNHLMKGCPAMDNDTRFTVLPDFRCQCNLCQKILKSKANVLRHLRVHAFQERKKSGQTEIDGPPTVEPLESSTLEHLSQNVEDHFQSLVNCVGFQCLLCGQEFRFKSSMITHVRIHLNQRLFKCQECSKTFFARNMLKKHQQNHTKPYKCPACGKGFIRRYLMREHYRKRHEQEDPLKDVTEHHDKKLIECDICGKIMKSYQKSLMLSHIRLHKDVRPYQCKVCNKSFISDNTLKKHSLNHTKPYKCQFCQKSFSRRYLLTDHFRKKCSKKKGALLASMKANGFAEESATDKVDGSTQASTGNTPGESVPYEAKIITEIDTATGLTTFICEPCDKRFTVYENLSRHLNTFAKPNACKYCGTVFIDKHLSIAHQRSCLGMAVNPGVVNKVKTMGEQQVKVQKIMKEIHEKLETITSTSAREEKSANVKVVVAKSVPKVSTSTPTSTSQSKDELQDSTQAASTPLSRTVFILKEEKGKFPCPECDRSFATPRGLKIHASSHVRLFKCDVCSKDFTQLNSLRAHAKKHQTEEEEEVENDEPEPKTPSRAMRKRRGDDPDMPVESVIPKETEENLVHRDKDDEQITTVMVPATRTKRGKRSITAADQEDSDDDKIEEMKVEHNDLENVNKRLMQSGTRGRPYSCKLCRRRFTEQLGLEIHMLQNHGVKLAAA